MTAFIKFREAVNAQLEAMSASGQLYQTTATKQELWDAYLGSFPEGTNPMYKERTEHDCVCCKQFIRAVGNVVAIYNGVVVSIWDIQVDNFYQEVAAAMSSLVKSKNIADTFLHPESKIGNKNNIQVVGVDTGNGPESSIRWEHFHHILDKKFVNTSGDIATILSGTRANKEVLKRSLEELTLSSAEIVIDLIDQKSIYRGEEHKRIVETFAKIKGEFEKLPEDQRDGFCWDKSTTLGGAGRIRNTMMGTLLQDLSEDMDLDKAVRRFEEKAYGYKRTTALISKKQIADAEQTVIDMGLQSALQRRYAQVSDLTINNVLFADRSVQEEMSVFSELTKSSKVKPQKLGKVEEVTVEQFLENILPKADSIEVMVENRHTSNLVSLIAPVEDSVSRLFKWENNFSWAYNGDVADSMKERVKELGGRVDGVLRFTHTWNYDGCNQSLMDLHVFMPGNNHKGGTSDSYGNGRRVGWNRRDDAASGGVQDVDFVNPPGKSVPLENITFPTKSRMPEGKYILKVHNWQFRSTTTSGFKAEIEFDGNTFSYEHRGALKNKEWITVAEITLKDGVFTIDHKMKEEASTQEVWGINTQQFHKVTTVLNSPNHWDGECTGNKHLFFMLEDCKQEGKARGFYNEFLRGELDKHRKVFEVLGSKLKTPESDQQLSGVGFSSTQNNSILCKVSGSFNRTIKINF